MKAPGVVVRLLILMLTVALPAIAAQPRAGHTKVIIAPQRGSIITSIVSSVGGTVINEYRSFSVAAIPTAAMPQLRRLADASNLKLTVRDDFDRLALAGGTVDTRRGVGFGPGRTTHYPPARPGLYVMQFVSQPLPEWGDALASRRIKLIQYIRENAYIVVATPERIALARDLPFVQFVDFMHPFLKSNRVRHGSSTADVLISFAPPEEFDIVTEARILLGTPFTVEIDTDREFRVRATLPAGRLNAIIASPLVHWIAEPAETSLSDERVAMGLMPKNIVNGQPTRPQRYRYELANLCTFCDDLNAEGFWVGVADTGIDRGIGTGGSDHHADLLPGSPSRLHFESSIDGGDPTFTDTHGHGTMVAGVIAGDPYSRAGTIPADSGTFYYGTGVVPSAGLFIQKEPASCGPVSTIAALASDARAQDVYVVNRSRNAGTAGEYEQLCIDADRDLIEHPITLTVSAGNRENASDDVATKSWGTAKNVISVGGAESVRPHVPNEQYCANVPGFASVAADDYNNAMSSGRHGTTGPPPVWYKPDLMAPASDVVSARSAGYSPPPPPPCPAFPSCSALGTYFSSSGTSFAAPVAAGAALLARRVYSEAVRGTSAPNPSSASPALVKAMLVGTARTMYGGIDRAHGNAVIGARPNNHQGFGRISVEDLVKQYPARQYVNESHSFASPSSPDWTQTYQVHDMNLPVVVALTWTDPPGPLGTPGSPRVNDLDLSVEIGSPCSERFLGNHPRADASDSSQSFACNGGTTDTGNTVEFVKFSPSAASFTVRVDPTMISIDHPPQKFGLFVLNAYVGTPAPPSAVTSFSAGATTTTNVHLSWQPSAGAASYEVQRAADGLPFAALPGTASTTYNDPVPSNKAYVYRVRAKNANGVSEWAVDPASTVPFTETPASGMAVRLIHLTELRTGVNKFREAIRLTPWSYTESSPTTVKPLHITELRTALNEARALFDLVPLTYQSVGSGTPIKAADLSQIQNAVK